jgi:hypothetical protein
MSAVKEDIAAGVVTIGNINNVVSVNDSGYSQELLDIHARHIERGRLIALSERISNRGDREREIERINRDTLHIDVIAEDRRRKKGLLNANWLKHLQAGRRHCIAGIPPESDNPHYLRGYGRQYELEQKQSAMCLH